MSPAASVAPVLRLLNPEIWVVTAAATEARGGLVATTLMPVSIVPECPRVALTVARQHATWPLIERSGAFAAHLIGEEQIDLAWRFGLQSGRDVEKLDGVASVAGITGSPILADVVGWIECRIVERLDIGDRTLYVADVVAGERNRDATPLTMRRLLELAPEDRRRQLREQLDRDAAIDAEAIRQWRSRRANG